MPDIHTSNTPQNPAAEPAPTPSHHAGTPPEASTPADLATTPQSDEAFARAVLAIITQNASDTTTVAAAVVRSTPAPDADQPIATHPTGAPASPWLPPLAQLIERAATEKHTVESQVTVTHTTPDGTNAERTLTTLAVPLLDDLKAPHAPLVVAILVAPGTTQTRDVRTRAELAAALYTAQQQRRQATVLQTEAERLTTALAVVDAFNAHPKFTTATRALADTLATSFDADRAVVATNRNDTPRVVALSHTDRFSRKQSVVREIEDVLDECVDQRDTVTAPAPSGQTTVARDAAAFAAANNTAVCTVPLIHGETVVAAITLERPANTPFQTHETASLELIAEYTAPRFRELERNDRPLPRKALDDARTAAASLLGPRHTAIKLAAILLSIAILASFLIPTADVATGPFVILPTEHRTISAPFDARITHVLVTHDQRVQAGDIILELDTSPLVLERSAAEARLEAARTRVAAARAESSAAEAEIAAAQAREAQATIDLLNERIAAGTLRAPIDGTITTPSPQSLEGLNAARAAPLLTITDTSNIYASVLISESRIAQLQPDQPVTLAPASRPSDTLEGTVHAISPTAEPTGSSGGGHSSLGFAPNTPTHPPQPSSATPGNAYRVHITLPDHAAQRIRPGAEGVARIQTGTTSLAERHTRDLVNWIRLQLFKL